MPLKSRFLFLLVLALAVLLLAAPAFCGWNPPGWELSPSAPEYLPVSTGETLLFGGLKFYQKVVSPVDSSRCPSYPTCSAYAVEAVRVHGPLLGATLTAARLVSEADEAAFSPRIIHRGVLRVYDPVPATLFIGEGERAP
jgi:putative membrane protein insertion efficiency factor